MTGHQATTVRRNGPGSVWFAVCPNGCRLERATSKEHAEWVADGHVQRQRLLEVRSITDGLTCTCYYPDEMEFHPNYTCPKCQLIAALGETA